MRGGRKVLDGVTLSVAPGDIVAVVGPNGAGKTTLLEAAIGALPVRSGEVRVGGRTLTGIRERARALFFLAGEAEPPAEVPVGALLEHALAAPGADRRVAADLTDRLGLRGLQSTPAGALSRGERRRLLLFAALVSAKPFLLLDEPTGVFDPLQLLEVIALFRACAGRGTGLVVTVHQMSDAEALASRILVLDEGRALSCDTMDGLRARAGLPGTASLQQVFLALLQTRQSERNAPRCSVVSSRWSCGRASPGSRRRWPLCSSGTDSSSPSTCSRPGARSAQAGTLMAREFDPLLGIVRPTLGGLYLALSLVWPADRRASARDREGPPDVKHAAPSVRFRASIVCFASGSPRWQAPAAARRRRGGAALGLDRRGRASEGVRSRDRLRRLRCLRGVRDCRGPCCRRLRQQLRPGGDGGAARDRGDLRDRRGRRLLGPRLDGRRAAAWSPTRYLHPFEEGTLALSSVGWFAGATVGALALAGVGCRFDLHGARRAAAVVGGAVIVLVASLPRRPQGARAPGTSREAHRHSLPPAAARELAQPPRPPGDHRQPRSRGQPAPAARAATRWRSCAWPAPTCACAGCPTSVARRAALDTSEGYGQITIALGDRFVRDDVDQPSRAGDADLRAGRPLAARLEPAGISRLSAGHRRRARTAVLAVSYLVLPALLLAIGVRAHATEEAYEMKLTMAALSPAVSLCSAPRSTPPRRYRHPHQRARSPSTPIPTAAPPTAFEGVVGDWYVGEADGKKGLMVDGTRWRQGTPSANLADQAKRLYGDRYAEFLDGVKAFAFFPLADLERRVRGRSPLLRSLLSDRRPDRSGRRHRLRHRQRRQLLRVPRERARGQPALLQGRER